MSRLTKYLGGDLQVLMVGNVFESAMRFAAFVIYSRILSPFDLGLVAAITAVVQLMTDLTSFGIDASVISLGSKELGKGDRDRLSRLCQSGLWLHLGLGILLSGLACLAARPLAARYFQDPALFRVLIVVFVGSLFVRLSEYVLSILRTYQRFRHHAVSGVSATLFLLLGSVWLSFTGRVTVFNILALLLLLTPLVKLFVGLLRTPVEVLRLHRPHGKRIREVLVFGRWIWGTNLLESAVRRTNILLLQAFAGNEATGYFHVASRYVEFLSLVFQPLRKYLLPKFTALQTRRAIARMLRRTYVPLAWTLLLIPVAWILAGPVITIVQGPEWRAAVALFRIVVVARLVFLLTKPMTFVVFSLGRPRVQTMLHLVAAGVFLVCAATLIPTFGAPGSAYSMLVFSVTVFVSLAWYLRTDWARAAGPGTAGGGSVGPADAGYLD
jgi:O-antigen/teichoic acid export membrane protein